MSSTSCARRECGTSSFRRAPSFSSTAYAGWTEETAMANEPDRRRAQELDQAERWMREDTSDRKSATWAVAIAIVLHIGLLAARMPGWSDPVRIEKPEEEVAMK